MAEPGVLGSIFPVQGGNGALFAGNFLREVTSVLPHSVEQTRPGVVEPRHSHEIQSGIFGYAAFLHRKTIAVEDGQLNQREIKPVTGRPNDVRDPGRLPIDF